MSELNLLAPAIVALVLCVCGLGALYWLTHNRPIYAPPAPPHEQAEEAQDVLPFDELKTQEELREAIRSKRTAYDRIPERQQS